MCVSEVCVCVLCVCVGVCGVCVSVCVSESVCVYVCVTLMTAGGPHLHWETRAHTGWTCHCR